MSELRESPLESEAAFVPRSPLRTGRASDEYADEDRSVSRGKKTRDVFTKRRLISLTVRDCISGVPESKDGQDSSPKRVKKSTRKLRLLRDLFNLSAEESLIGEFNCALKKKILLQGRLYLFEQHVCFYANVFGYVKKKVIPVKQITNVRKAKYAALFHNAVEISFEGGGREFFTSFLSRDKAYAKITKAWTRAVKPESAGEGGYPEVPALSSEARRLSLSSALPVNGSAAAVVGRSTQSFPFTDSDANLRMRQTASVSDESSSEHGGDDFPFLEMDAANCSEMSKAEEAEADAVQAEEDEDDENADMPMLLQSRLHDMQLLIQGEVCCTVQEFFDQLWGNDSSFFKDFLEGAGQDCKDVTQFKWTAHEHLGHARDVTFISPVKTGFRGVKRKANCHQTQSYRFVNKSYLILETSQVMTSDIPYIDYFRVEMRWDVRGGPAQGACSVSIMVDVPFTRKTVFRQRIESNVRSETRKQYTNYLALANLHVEDQRGRARHFSQPARGSRRPSYGSLASRRSVKSLAEEAELPEGVSRERLAEMKVLMRLLAKHGGGGGGGGSDSEVERFLAAEDAPDKKSSLGVSLLWVLVGLLATVMLASLVFLHMTSMVHNGSCPGESSMMTQCKNGGCIGASYNRKMELMNKELEILRERTSLLYNEMAVAKVLHQMLDPANLADEFPEELVYDSTA